MVVLYGRILVSMYFYITFFSLNIKIKIHNHWNCMHLHLPGSRFSKISLWLFCYFFIYIFFFHISGEHKNNNAFGFLSFDFTIKTCATLQIDISSLGPFSSVACLFNQFPKKQNSIFSIWNPSLLWFAWLHSLLHFQLHKIQLHTQLPRTVIILVLETIKHGNSNFLDSSFSLFDNSIVHSCHHFVRTNK